MTAAELVEPSAQRSFQPLRLDLSDGRIRYFRQPEMTIVSDRIVSIEAPRNAEPRIATKITSCSLADIAAAEPLETGG